MAKTAMAGLVCPVCRDNGQFAAGHICRFAVTAVLGVIVGTKPLPRSAMTKKLWDYIKKNNLQDPKKRTMINADPALKAVFGGKKQVSMFEMTKLVSAHVK